jgi:hypothetical protein
MTISCCRTTTTAVGWRYEWTSRTIITSRISGNGTRTTSTNSYRVSGLADNAWACAETAATASAATTVASTDIVWATTTAATDKQKLNSKSLRRNRRSLRR